MIQSLIYSNGNQECERAKMLLQSFNEDIKEYVLGKDFTIRQFTDEFGNDAEFPQISIGLNHRGTLKETLQYLKQRGTLV